MLKATVNGKQYTIEPEAANPFKGLVEGMAYELDATGAPETGMSVLYNNKSYTVVLLKSERDSKQYTLQINGSKYDITLKDKLDDLLAGMGLTAGAAAKLNNIKAPMPGLVLNILVAEGDTITKGDALLVLEAMKMENIIKSPGEGVVKKINVNKGQAVEKNQVLIEIH
jgi:biotin carboxyl carrier protein